jgi:hypothetical protein
MSISAWAQACASQASRSKQSLEQSSYGSNAFTVRSPTHHLPVLLPHFQYFRLHTAPSNIFSCAFPLQIASFSISFLVSAYWLLLWIRFKHRSRASPAEISRPSDDIPGAPEKIWRHYGLFAALVCAGRQRTPLRWRILQTLSHGSAVSAKNSRDGNVVITRYFVLQEVSRELLLGHSTFAR